MLLSVSQLSHSGKMSQTSKFFLGETLIMVVTSALLVVVNCQSEVPPISSNVTSVFTLESVRKLAHNATLNKIVSQNCTTFYDTEETDFYMNECSPLVEDPDFMQSLALGKEYIKPVNSTKQRRNARNTVEKQFLPVGIRIRNHNPFRIMESKAIVEQPCVGKCMMMKLQLLTKTGKPNRTEILTQIRDVLSSIRDAEDQIMTVADACLKRYQNRMTKISKTVYEKLADRIAEECRAAAKLGICLPRDTFKVCKQELIGSAISRKPGAGKP